MRQIWIRRLGTSASGGVASLDLVRQISIRWHRSHASAEWRRTAGDGGGRRRIAAELAGETQSWVSGLGSARGRHHGDARETPKPSRVALAAGMRRRRCTSRQGGAVRRRSFCELIRAARCTGTSTNGAVDFLTSFRVSGAAPRRRSGDDGGMQRWR
jgi:hypothetical protein